MVYMPYQRSEGSKSVKSNLDSNPKVPDAMRNNHFKDLGISETEARQLMDHEQSLMEEGQKMNIKYTDLNEDAKSKKTTQRQKHTTDELHIRLNKNERSVEKKQKQQKIIGISEEELGELVDEYDLSQVSQNLNSILNESDFKAFNNNEMPNSSLLTPADGKSDYAALKGMIADKKQRKSGISKFMKKE